ncbi:hypothetical protein Poly41_24270 [Novipirellula artificiosorum]|uniref:Uncharacterized protein n=1 Tax=Novipirellula artificiosorum TaxID=2528016 RepID=A0A5C6DSC2_9BACT|nr:hypothetical protein Poly41_24270 [Novipirellula artificiosorum]
MWSATVAVVVESKRLRLLFAVIIGLVLIAPAVDVRAAIGQEPNSAKQHYVPFAILRYERAELCSTESELLPTGFVLTPIPAEEANKAKMVVSAAFEIGTPLLRNLRLVLSHDAGSKTPSWRTIPRASVSSQTLLTGIPFDTSLSAPLKWRPTVDPVRAKHTFRDLMRMHDELQEILDAEK